MIAFCTSWNIALQSDVHMCCCAYVRHCAYALAPYALRSFDVVALEAMPMLLCPPRLIENVPVRLTVGLLALAPLGAFLRAAVCSSEQCPLA